MLVPEMIDVPGLIGDHDVVVAILDDLLKQHEVGDHDLVHAAQRLEYMQIVLASFVLDVRGFADEQAARRMHALPRRLKQSSDRVLCEPVDLELWAQSSKLTGNSQVAARVSESDG